MSGTFTPGKPGGRPGTASGDSGALSRGPEAAVAQPTIKCPKCGSDARAVARFCQRCHATLRFACPSCNHEQRQGGQCEKCGINFLKYIGAVVAAKQAKADADTERLDRRSAFLKHIIAIPLTGGLTLVKLLFGRNRD